MNVKRSRLRLAHDGIFLSNEQDFDAVDYCDVYLEMCGGGGGSKDIANDPQKILIALESPAKQPVENACAKTQLKTPEKAKDKDVEYQADDMCKRNNYNFLCMEHEHDGNDWIECLQSRKSAFSGSSSLDKSIFHLLSRTKLEKYEICKLRNLLEMREKSAASRFFQGESETPKAPKRKRKIIDFPKFSPKILRKRKRYSDVKRSVRDSSMIRKKRTVFNVTNCRKRKATVSVDVSDRNLCFDKEELDEIVTGEQVQFHDQVYTEANLTLNLEEEVLVNKPLNKIDVVHENEYNVDNDWNSDIETPFNEPPDKDKRTFSLAAHLHAHLNFGGSGFLHKEELKEEHFQEMLQLYGPEGQLRLIRGFSVEYCKKMWSILNKASTNLDDQEPGVPEHRNIHNSTKGNCFYNHCKIGQFNMDLVCLTPRSKEKFDGLELNLSVDSETNIEEALDVNRNNSAVTRKLFNEKDMPSFNIITNYGSNSVNSPTKEELKREVLRLRSRIDSAQLNVGNINNQEVKSKQLQEHSVRIPCDLCNKNLTSYVGYLQHRKNVHKKGPSEDDNQTFECPICHRSFKYLDAHMKTIHPDNVRKNCPICKKNHKKRCKKCPFCNKPYKRKNRLEDHILKCPVKLYILASEKPLDLSTPRKVAKAPIFSLPKDAEDRISNTVGDSIVLDLSNEKDNTDQRVRTPSKRLITPNPLNISCPEAKSNQLDNPCCVDLSMGGVSDHSPSLYEEDDVESSSNMDLKQGRHRYPFDKEDSGEEYVSEFESQDEEEDIKDRRQRKDDLESELRVIDSLDKPHDNQEEFLQEFRQYLRIKKVGRANVLCDDSTNSKKSSDQHDSNGNEVDNPEATSSKKKSLQEEYKRAYEPATIDIYTNSLRKYLMPAFGKLYSPFHPSWILDCTTVKEVTFDGKERSFINPTEPLYTTSVVLTEALKIIDSYGGQSSSERGILLSAVSEFLTFVERHFDDQMGNIGPAPLEKLRPYHDGVRTFLTAAGEWKTSNNEKRRALQENKTLKNHVNPTKDAEILKLYKQYCASNNRRSTIDELMKFSSPDAPSPTPKEFNKLTNFVGGEAILSTGARPVVWRLLPNGPYVDKSAGFNPHEISEGDNETQEEQEGLKLPKRINPNMPPRS